MHETIIRNYHRGLEIIPFFLLYTKKFVIKQGILCFITYICTMSKSTTKILPQIYRHNMLDFGLFTWISAIKEIVPSVSINDCIEMYKDFYNIEDEEFNSESAAVTYNRIRNQYVKYKDGKV